MTDTDTITVMDTRLRSVPGATIPIILTPARPMATTDRVGSWVGSLSGPAPGTTGIGVTVDTGVAVGTGVMAVTTVTVATMAGPDITATPDITTGIAAELDTPTMAAALTTVQPVMLEAVTHS